MRGSIGFGRLLAMGIIVAASVGSLAQAAHAGPPPPAVPTDIAVPAGHKVYLVGHAVGVQIHACDATSTGFAWRFVAPRAELFDDQGNLVTTHFGGPTWQARDGSMVRGRRDAGVTVDPTAIEWLRLTVASKVEGTDGDRLVHTTYIQRIATTGGLTPPAAECTAATAGTQREVPYTADYYFWKGQDG
jgi:hypothetical protein